jgi:electron transfer flavoprotein-quinone oxidoreductase
MWMMDETSYVGMHYRSEDFNEERPNRYTIIRTQFDKWFSRRVRDAGAVVLDDGNRTSARQSRQSNWRAYRSHRRRCIVDYAS